MDILQDLYFNNEEKLLINICKFIREHKDIEINEKIVIWIIRHFQNGKNKQKSGEYDAK
jgi:hypothetical protein